MNRADIITIEIDDFMRRAAEDYSKAVARLDKKHTLQAVSGMKHDYYGHLAEQAVQQLLESKNIPFESGELIGGPDDYDFEIYDKKVDVKATHRNNYDIDKWWNYQNFLVFQHQIDRGILEKKDSLIFCVIDDPRSKVYVFGGIYVNEFMKKARYAGPSTNPNLKWDNMQISVLALTPFWRFIYEG